ncbi:N2227-domain-containing protein [Trichodelitschia bisporula]|uniref:carnosine N-methyltransferase n=1 Tax=Trichodelitschia bisporula TaxID=703511 RepID=A0A6G1I8T6_9PEZI|nr:N2227-domain-containing protein [Trichodelitschia bisporula]
MFPDGVDTDRLYKAFDAFRRYNEAAENDILLPRRQLASTLTRPEEDRLREMMNQRLNACENLLQVNGKIAWLIHEQGRSWLQWGVDTTFDPASQGHLATEEDHAIVRSTIRQIWRDWSKESESERYPCHQAVMEDVQNYSQRTPTEGAKRILVPGAGLCRLPFNLAAAGHDVEANEVSYHQLLATNFILSYTREYAKHHIRNLAKSDSQIHLSRNGNQIEVYPWVTQFSNHVKTDDQFRHYSIPDLCPVDVLHEVPSFDFSSGTLGIKMANLQINGRDFTKDFQGPEHSSAFDILATVFFLDTATNVLDYMRTAWHILKPGGQWINVGPLLWNCYENGPGGRREGDVDDDENARARQVNGQQAVAPGKQWDMKIELSNQEILALLEQIGFTLIRNNEDMKQAGYVRDTTSMLQNVYQCAHWVVEKPAED